MCIRTLKFLSTNLVLNFNWSIFPSFHPVLCARERFPASFIRKTPPLGSSAATAAAAEEEESHAMKDNLSILNIPWPDAILTSLPWDQPILKLAEQS